MFFIYENNSFKCVCKSMMKKDMWYSMEPVKVKVTIPKSLYNEILKDIKNDEDNETLHDIIRFRIQKEKDEILFINESKDSVKSRNEYWDIDAYLDSATISSIYNSKNNDKETLVTTHFTINIFEKKKLEKSETRDILLSKIL